MRKTLIACVVTALLVGGGTATAAKLVTGKDVRNGSLSGADLKNGSVGMKELSEGTQALLQQGGPAGPKGDTGATGPRGPKGDTGATGAKGEKGDKGGPGLANLEADGPYPGATDLGQLTNQGDNSDAIWSGNSTARHTSWVQCAPDKVALGGGFHLAADAGDAAARQIQVVVSEPTTVRDGALVDGAIPGDEALSIRPNGWLVQGFNNGSNDVIVRPWVVCAEIAD